MAEIVEAAGPPLTRLWRSPLLASLGDDRPWLIVMAVVTALELTWWAAIWSFGYAPAPFLLTYLGLAFAGLACALALRALLYPRAGHPNWSSVVPATVLVGIGASLFLPLKYAIPYLVPFWLDAPLAQTERVIFGTDPWFVLDHLLGWATMPIDRLYGLWLPTQSLILFMVITQRPCAAKSRALIAYFLAWLLLGVVAAVLFSSAGPIFYDRMFGGSEFAPLRETLQNRGAWIVLAESDRMWSSLASSRPGLVAGISAVPSIHVAISVWIYLAARTMAPRATLYALAYVAFIAIGSVQLGWHYVTDGLAGALGMLIIWRLSGVVLRVLESAGNGHGDQASVPPA